MVDAFTDFKFKDGDSYSFIQNAKTFTALPGFELVKVDRWNLIDYAKRFSIPVCIFASVLDDVKYKVITDDSRIAFFDVETDDQEHFKYAYTKRPGELPLRFDDAKKLMEYLANFDFVVGHNICRFDFEVLSQLCSDHFKVKQFGNFKEFQPKHFLPIDTYVLARMNASVMEVGYSLYSLSKFCGYGKERLEVKDDSRCLQDIEMLELTYNGLHIKEAYNFISDYSRCDANTIMNSYSTRFVKQILYARYLANGFLPVTPPNDAFKEYLAAMHYARKGFYTSMKYSDISSTYPSSAIVLNRSLYDGETVFVHTMKELVEHAKNPDLKGYAKFISNVMIGTQRDSKNYFKNELLWCSILDLAHKEVTKIFKTVEDEVIYVNTDCFIIPEKVQVIHEWFAIKDKYHFKWIQIYDSNKIMGCTIEGGVVRRHFTKKYRYGLMNEATKKLDELLRKTSSDDVPKLLNDTYALSKPILKLIKRGNSDLLKIVIRKKSGIPEGTYAEFAFIWDQLKMGFNEVYHSKDGGFTTEPKKIDLKRYREDIMEMVKEYATN